jgi:4-amino-4-deoxy-L-arabinose transferase-like glycosyltransferase
MVAFVAQHGRLPRYHDEGFGVGLMDSMTKERLPRDIDARQLQLLVAMNHRFEVRQTYLFTPQMPYLLGGWFCRMLGGADVHQARLFTAACVALAALCAYLTGLVLWNGRVAPAAVAGLLVGLWPQLTFVGAYVNDDAFAVLSVSVLVLALAWADRGPLDMRRALALGAGLGLAGSSKYYTLAALSIAAVWLVLRARRGEPGFGRFAAVSLGVAVIVAGSWLARNAILYDGDPTGKRFLSAELQKLVASLPPEVAARTRKLWRPPAHSFFESMGHGWFRTTFESFWARFGWMNVRPHPAMYWTALAVVPAGFLWSLRPGGWRVVPGLFTVPLLALLLLLSLLNTHFADYQPQGRYLLSVVPPLCLQIAAGAFSGPPLARRILPWALVGFFVAQNLLARLLYLR